MVSVERQGAVDVVRIRGALNREGLDRVRQATDPLVARGRPSLVIDLAEMPLVDSAGLGWLLELDERCVARGGAMCVSGGSELCNEILRITGVGDRLERQDDLSSALASFAQ